MKKLLILGLAFLGATPVFAEYCAGGSGDVFTAINGKTYCLSRPMVNWWSANAWCDSIGMALVNPSEDCDCTGHEKCEIGPDCLNLKEIPTTVWTNSALDVSSVYVIWKGGSIGSVSKKGYKYKALCK